MTSGLPVDLLPPRGMSQAEKSGGVRFIADAGEEIVGRVRGCVREPPG